MTTQSTLVQIDGRKRASLGAMARFDQYMAREEPNGTIIFEPAVILTPSEKAFLADPELVAALANANSHPDRRRSRAKTSD